MYPHPDFNQLGLQGELTCNLPIQPDDMKAMAEKTSATEAALLALVCWWMKKIRKYPKAYISMATSASDTFFSVNPADSSLFFTRSRKEFLKENQSKLPDDRKFEIAQWAFMQASKIIIERNKHTIIIYHHIIHGKFGTIIIVDRASAGV